MTSSVRYIILTAALTALVGPPAAAQRTVGYQCPIDPSHTCTGDESRCATWAANHPCDAHGRCAGGSSGGGYTGPANPSITAFGRNVGNLLTGGIFRRRRSNPRPQPQPQPDAAPADSPPAPSYSPPTPRDDELARSVAGRRRTQSASTASTRDEELARSVAARRRADEPAATARNPSDELAEQLRRRRSTSNNSGNRGNSGGGGRTMDWARAASAAGGRAREAGDRARSPAGEVFDTPGERASGADPSVPAVPVGPREPERVPPALLRDPRYQQLQTRQQELQRQNTALQQELATVREQRNAGTGNVAALQVTEARIRQRVSNNEAQQNQNTFEQREMVQVANRGVSFGGSSTTPLTQQTPRSQQNRRPGRTP